MLADSFGRVIHNLRISVTDRCNLRCRYCMPEHVEFFARREILTSEEIARVARVAAGLGIHKFRLTGGEPLLRQDLPELVRQLAGLPGVRNLGLTTNGVRLKHVAAPLYRAGLRRINISLDSLAPEKFAHLTRRHQFHRVMEGIAAAEGCGFRPIKINVVAVRGFTEDEILPFVRLARQRNLVVRFIEFMPLDAGDMWQRELVLTKGEILDIISSVYPLARFSNGHTAEPAERYAFADLPPGDDGLPRGEIGIISSVSAPFCTRCNRIRLTADGKLRTCLFSLQEKDLKGPLRAGASDAELGDMIRAAVAGKEPGHLIGAADFVKPRRAMYQIGG